MQARMRPACLGAAVTGILIILGSGAFAQSNSDVGTWRLNVAKSKYSPGPAPTSATTKIEAVGAGVKVNTSVVSSDGKTRTVTTTGVDAKGQTVNNVAVYEKQ